MGNPQTFYTVVALAKETTWGTSTARTQFLPSEEPRFQPQALRHIVDEGFRGLGAGEFDLIPGPGEGTWQWDGNFYVDTSPHLLQGLMGATDTPTGTGPYVHSLAMAATVPSYSLEWNQNTQPYLFVGARVGSVKLTFSGKDGTLKYSAQGMSKLGTTVAATATSFGSVAAIGGWQASITIAGGASTAIVLEGEITISRALKPLHGLSNTQDIAALYAGPLMVAGRLTIDFSDTVAYNYYASSSPAKNAVVVTFTQGTASFSITMTKAGWKVVDIDRSDDLYQVTAQLTGLYNATDGGPVKFGVTNSVSTGY